MPTKVVVPTDTIGFLLEILQEHRTSTLELIDEFEENRIFIALNRRTAFESLIKEQRPFAPSIASIAERTSCCALVSKVPHPPPKIISDRLCSTSTTACGHEEGSPSPCKIGSASGHEEGSPFGCKIASPFGCELGSSPVCGEGPSPVREEGPPSGHEGGSPSMEPTAGEDGEPMTLDTLVVPPNDSDPTRTADTASLANPELLEADLQGLGSPIVFTQSEREPSVDGGEEPAEDEEADPNPNPKGVPVGVTSVTNNNRRKLKQQRERRERKTEARKAKGKGPKDAPAERAKRATRRSARGAKSTSHVVESDADSEDDGDRDAPDPDALPSFSQGDPDADVPKDRAYVWLTDQIEKHADEAVRSTSPKRRNEMIRTASTVGSAVAMEDLKSIYGHCRNNESTLLSPQRVQPTNRQVESSAAFPSSTAPPAIAMTDGTRVVVPRSALPKLNPLIQDFCTALRELNTHEVHQKLYHIFRRQRLADLYDKHLLAKGTIKRTGPSGTGVKDSTWAFRVLFLAANSNWGDVDNLDTNPMTKATYKKFKTDIIYGHKWQIVRDRLGPGGLLLIPETKVSNTVIERLPLPLLEIWTELVCLFRPRIRDLGELVFASARRLFEGRRLPRRRIYLETIPRIKLYNLENKADLFEEMDEGLLTSEGERSPNLFGTLLHASLGRIPPVRGDAPLPLGSETFFEGMADDVFLGDTTNLWSDEAAPSWFGQSET